MKKVNQDGSISLQALRQKGSPLAFELDGVVIPLLREFRLPKLSGTAEYVAYSIAASAQVFLTSLGNFDAMLTSARKEKKSKLADQVAGAILKDVLSLAAVKPRDYGEAQEKVAYLSRCERRHRLDSAMIDAAIAFETEIWNLRDVSIQ